VTDDGSNSIWRVSYTGSTAQKSASEPKHASNIAKNASN